MWHVFRADADYWSRIGCLTRQGTLRTSETCLQHSGYDSIIAKRRRDEEVIPAISLQRPHPDVREDEAKVDAVCGRIVVPLHAPHHFAMARTYVIA